MTNTNQATKYRKLDWKRIEAGVYFAFIGSLYLDSKDIKEYYPKSSFEHVEYYINNDSRGWCVESSTHTHDDFDENCFKTLKEAKEYLQDHAECFLDCEQERIAESDYEIKSDEIIAPIEKIKQPEFKVDTKYTQEGTGKVFTCTYKKGNSVEIGGALYSISSDKNGEYVISPCNQVIRACDAFIDNNNSEIKEVSKPQESRISMGLEDFLDKYAEYDPEDNLKLVFINKEKRGFYYNKEKIKTLSYNECTENAHIVTETFYKLTDPLETPCLFNIEIDTEVFQYKRPTEVIGVLPVFEVGCSYYSEDKTKIRKVIEIENIMNDDDEYQFTFIMVIDQDYLDIVYTYKQDFYPEMGEYIETAFGCRFFASDKVMEDKNK